ncbi:MULTISPECIES: hypothetical protein [unclassified Enterococcus]|uniref:hypothetical protein n=1 Tax=unclassified Enterococcus TaxID=2608891 RepID=UPI000A359512|nr:MULTISPECIES: hypothetical protein [unclassified Enterococcus]OTO71306.1 hypothetical protein A5865_003002 [Enterococcus sp. 12E11_DIV0728]OUZ15318.1 hypothetical protein A5868_000226 [Enterococcus sp. 12F9_DIV0723]
MEEIKEESKAMLIKNNTDFKNKDIVYSTKEDEIELLEEQEKLQFENDFNYQCDLNESRLDALSKNNF